MGGSEVKEDDKYSLPDDWIYFVKHRILKLVPAYTLSMLAKEDMYILLPYYCWDYRMALKNKELSETDIKADNSKYEIVYREGKAYRKVKAGQASWTNNIF